MPRSDTGSAANEIARQIFVWQAGPVVNRRAVRPRPFPSIGPVDLHGSRVLFRLPRYSDFESWRTARLSSWQRLAPVFSKGEIDWAALHTRQVWVEHCYQVRRAAMRDGAAPLAIVLVTDDGDERLVGEVGVDAVDPVTWSGEGSAWMSQLAGSKSIVLLAGACAALICFSRPPALRRILFPCAVTNLPTIRVARALGGTKIADARGLRLYSGSPVDHELWVVENTAERRDYLAKVALTELDSHD